MTEMIGRTLAGRYEVMELIGEGGMAEVYKARHIQLDRFVAIKIMHRFLTKDKTFKSRFEQEAQLGARLAHPNVIHVYDFEANEIERLYYIAVELIVGPSLNVVLTELAENNQRMAITDVLRIVSDVASALGYAHSQGMIHRDVKPANILLENGQRVVLTDFGIAKLMNSNYGATKLTTSEALLGTPAYMAPEQALGNAGDARSDLYSLGVMMYQMVTGRLPFWAESPIALAMKHVHDVPKAPRTIDADIPLKLNNVIMRSILKDPAERYQSADQMLAELAALENGKGAAQVRKAAPQMAMPAERERPSTINLDAPSYTTINFEQDDSPRVVIPAVAPTEMALPRRSRRGFLVSFSVIALLPLLALGAFIAGNSSFNHVEPTATVDVTGTSVALAATDSSVAATQVVLYATQTAQSFTLTPAPCMATANKSARVLTSPQGFALGLLNENVPVTGSIQDKTTNQRWWRVDYNQRTGWVADNSVTVTGGCDTVPAAESPAQLPVYTASPTSTTEPRSTATEFFSANTGSSGSNNGGGSSGGYHPPHTPIPNTAVPNTPVPNTPIPNTAVPNTPVPNTPIPDTPVPNTPVPPPPDTAVPPPPDTAVPPSNPVSQSNPPGPATP